MARLSKNSLMQGLRGSIGKQLVFKTYNDKTVVSRYPDMSGLVPTQKQKESRSLFKEAVKYARAIILDPEARLAYAAKLPKGKSVYHAALQAFMKKGGVV